MVIRNVLFTVAAVFISLFFVTPTFAHVIVYPKQAGVAQTQVFDMSVPAEKNNPTIAVKLLIPTGVQDVVPNVKPGWTISVEKKEDNVTEIDWTNGSIPAGQRDDFYFQAQVPPTATTLKWKAYQTYQDGSVIAWDHNPTASPEDGSASAPYSTTQVVNDLAQKPTVNSSSDNTTLIFSIAALALSALSFGMAIRRK